MTTATVRPTCPYCEKRPALATVRTFVAYSGATRNVPTCLRCVPRGMAVTATVALKGKGGLFYAAGDRVPEQDVRSVKPLVAYVGAEVADPMTAEVAV